jgi:hypothetical protein
MCQAQLHKRHGQTQPPPVCGLSVQARHGIRLLLAASTWKLAQQLQLPPGKLAHPLSQALWSSPSAPRMLLALRPWDPEAEQFLEVSLLLFFLLFSDPRPRDRLRLLERLREPM